MKVFSHREIFNWTFCARALKLSPLSDFFVGFPKHPSLHSRQKVTHYFAP
jgi:hypothetical protein